MRIGRIAHRQHARRELAPVAVQAVILQIRILHRRFAIQEVFRSPCKETVAQPARALTGRTVSQDIHRVVPERPQRRAVHRIQPRLPERASDRPAAAFQRPHANPPDRRTALPHKHRRLPECIRFKRLQYVFLVRRQMVHNHRLHVDLAECKRVPIAQLRHRQHEVGFLFRTYRQADEAALDAPHVRHHPLAGPHRLRQAALSLRNALLPRCNKAVRLIRNLLRRKEAPVRLLRHVKGVCVQLHARTVRPFRIRAPRYKRFNLPHRIFRIRHATGQPFHRRHRLQRHTLLRCKPHRLTHVPLLHKVPLHREPLHALLPADVQPGREIPSRVPHRRAACKQLCRQERSLPARRQRAAVIPRDLDQNLIFSRPVIV